MYYEEFNTFPYQNVDYNYYNEERANELFPSTYPPVSPRPPFSQLMTPRPPFSPQMTPRPPFLPPSNIGRINRCLNRETLITLNNGFSFWFYPTYVSRNSVFGFRWRRNGWSQESIDLNSIISVNCSR